MKKKNMCVFNHGTKIRHYSSFATISTRQKGIEIGHDRKESPFDRFVTYNYCIFTLSIHQISLSLHHQYKNHILKCN